MKWEAATPGEELFLAIRDQALPSLSVMESCWDDLNDVFLGASGSHQFANYLRGAVSVVAMKRLLQFWAGARQTVIAPDQQVRVVSDFISHEVFTGLDRAIRMRVARLVIEALRCSYREVTPRARRRLLNGTTAVTCYLCGAALDATVSDQTDDRLLTFEHLWPKSAGGDNIDENLLPACRHCQNAKADALSWEWLNVHNLILAAAPSADAFRSVPRGAKIARRYLHVMQLCEESRLSLKEGFLRAGPWSGQLTARRTGHPVTFFDLRI